MLIIGLIDYKFKHQLVLDVMPLMTLIILAAIQGLTEFLPISSSGHLVFMPQFFNMTDQGLEIDVAVHLGSMFAVVLYFHRDVLGLFTGLFDYFTCRRTDNARLMEMVVIATVPILIAGALLHSFVPHGIRSVEVIGWATLVFGVILGISDRCDFNDSIIEKKTNAAAFVIGLAQILALIPGTSRSGITMTAARFLKINRVQAGRFSMLLSIPAILAASLITGYDVYHAGDTQSYADMIYAVVISFVTAFAAIHFFMRWISKFSFMPFVVYRIVLGIGILAYIYI